MKVVQIGAGNYTSIQLRMDPIKRGEVVEVDNEVGNHLLSQVYLDVAKNPHPYFVEVGDPRAARYLGAAAPEAPKATPKRRRKKTVVQPTAAETEE